MHYLKNGRAIPGFESEDIIDASEPIEIDVEQLSADLENAQATILEESNKYSSALEAMDELENTIGDIEVAMESDVDLVTAQLLVNSLNKYSNTLYGKDLQSAGLQSDNPKNVLEAGLLDAKGMLSAVKEFIAKVWQKIKDAFAFVWKKMKDFWAWLTGSKKKAKEKLEETIVAAATVEAAETKKEDIRKAADEDFDTILDRIKKRGKQIDEMMNAGVEEDKKVNLSDIKKMDSEEFTSFMSGSGLAKTVVIKSVTKDIIVEEVSKATGIDEEIVAKNIPNSILESIGKTTAVTNNRQTQTIANKIIAENIKNNKEALTKTILASAVFKSLQKPQGVTFKYKLSTAFSDYDKWIENVYGKDKVANMILNYLRSYLTHDIAEILYDSANPANTTSGYFKLLEKSIEDMEQILNNGNKLLNVDWAKLDMEYDLSADLNLEFFPTSVVQKGSMLVVNYINPFKNGSREIGDVSLFTNAFDNSERILYDLQMLSKKINWDVMNSANNSNIVQSKIEKLIKTSEGILKEIDTNESKYKDDKDWQVCKNTFVRFIGNVSFYNPKIIIDAAKANLDSVNNILNIIDISGAIAQATKEGK